MDSVCQTCEAPNLPFTGIQTSLGFVCYNCVRWIHAVADQTAALRDQRKENILSEIDETP
jgi:hypothetical protein